MKQYYSTGDVMEILGCSAGHARQVMMSMPHMRFKASRGSTIRVRIEDFDDFIQQHIVQPGEFQPRTTPYPTAAEEIKAWHKKKA